MALNIDFFHDQTSFNSRQFVLCKNRLENLCLFLSLPRFYLNLKFKLCIHFSFHSNSYIFSIHVIYLLKYTFKIVQIHKFYWKYEENKNGDLELANAKKKIVPNQIGKWCTIPVSVDKFAKFYVIIYGIFMNSNGKRA